MNTILSRPSDLMLKKRRRDRVESAKAECSTFLEFVCVSLFGDTHMLDDDEPVYNIHRQAVIQTRAPGERWFLDWASCGMPALATLPHRSDFADKAKCLYCGTWFDERDAILHYHKFLGHSRPTQLQVEAEWFQLREDWFNASPNLEERLRRIQHTATQPRGFSGTLPLNAKT